MVAIVYYTGTKPNGTRVEGQSAVSVRVNHPRQAHSVARDSFMAEFERMEDKPFVALEITEVKVAH